MTFDLIEHLGCNSRVIVGDGMMARAFSAFADDKDVIVFASGVSDSTETRAAAFSREAKLLRRTRAEHPQALLIYFGTCSVYDPDRRNTPYVGHKIAMELMLKEADGPWLVLRLPLAVGPGHRGNTLARFLYDRILRGESFEVWKGSTRYPIDVEDACRIATRLIRDPSMWRRTVNIALRAFPVTDFVRVLEKIAGKAAVYQLVEKGQHYEVPCPEIAGLLDQLEIRPGADYLEKVLRKYFMPRR
jgi:nucleoside-diphosphate-sugar epimerase